VAAAGVAAFSGGAGAADTTLEASDPDMALTDDGEIEYVAFGGRLPFEWDGLDSEATWGGYRVETRVNTGPGRSNWRSHGQDEGELGANWGGHNGHTKETGTEGVFQFKYGSPYGQPSYAIAGSTGDTRDAKNKYDTSTFEADADGGKQKTSVEFRMTCRVHDGGPVNSGNKLIEASDTAEVVVHVKNRKTTDYSGSVSVAVPAEN